MTYDLLTDAIGTTYAVNCRIEGTTLHCGAFYLEPQIPFESIRLSHSGGNLEVELPLAFRNQPQCIVAWDVPLQLRQHEQVF